MKIRMMAMMVEMMTRPGMTVVKLRIQGAWQQHDVQRTL